MSIVDRGREFLGDESQAKEAALKERIRQNLSKINSVFVTENASLLLERLNALGVAQSFEELHQHHIEKPLPSWYNGEPPIPVPTLTSGTIVKIGWDQWGLFPTKLYVPLGCDNPELVRSDTGQCEGERLSKVDITEVKLQGVYEQIILPYPWADSFSGWETMIGKGVIRCDVEVGGEGRIEITGRAKRGYNKIIVSPTADQIRAAIGAVYVSIFEES